MGTILLQCIESGGTYGHYAYGDEAGERLLGLSGYMVTRWCSFLISLVPCVFEKFFDGLGTHRAVIVKGSY